MTTEKLYEFLILSQTLSFSAAAKKLFMTQSTLSRHIAELEEELGVLLLERSTHSVRLTQPGRLLASRVPGLMQKRSAALSRLRLAGSTSGSVSICCLENSIHEQLVIFLNYFTAKYPDIDISIDILSRSDRIAVFESYDLSFTGFELQKLPTNISSALAFRSPGVLSTLESHRLFNRHNVVNLEDLAGETLLVPYADEVFCSYSAVRQLAEKLTGYTLNIVKVPNVESALAMVAFGKGLAILPQHLSQNTLLNVWSLDIATPGCVFDTYVYHNSGRDNPAARQMLEELLNFNARGE